MAANSRAPSARVSKNVDASDPSYASGASKISNRAFAHASPRRSTMFPNLYPPPCLITGIFHKSRGSSTSNVHVKGKGADVDDSSIVTLVPGIVPAPALDTSNTGFGASNHASALNPFGTVSQNGARRETSSSTPNAATTSSSANVLCTFNHPVREAPKARARTVRASPSRAIAPQHATRATAEAIIIVTRLGVVALGVRLCSRRSSSSPANVPLVDARSTSTSNVVRSPDGGDGDDDIVVVASRDLK